MANIVNFTDKQFENRLNDNLEELVQGINIHRPSRWFFLCGHSPAPRAMPKGIISAYGYRMHAVTCYP